MKYQELLALAKQAKNSDEMCTLAKEKGMELSEEVAKEYFDRIHSSGDISDDELENVSGGKCDEDNPTKPITPEYKKSCYVCSACYNQFNDTDSMWHHCGAAGTLMAHHCTDCLFYRSSGDKNESGHFCKK